MLDSRLRILAEILEDGGYKTARQLAKCCGISEKTARIRLKELKDSMIDCGACLVSKKGSGYKLVINDRKIYTEFLYNGNDIPSSPEDRLQYLIALFISQRSYIKKEKLCEFLFISERTLTTELKK